MLIEEYGEEAFLAELKAMFAPTAEGVPAGIGDDAAVLKAKDAANVWTTDMMIEGVHFRRQWQTAAELGRKALTVNLSDLASMGAYPRYALLSLGVPAGTAVEFLLQLCRGICDQAQEASVALIGGDTTASGSGLVISITLGGAVGEAEALLRSGASPGDRILLTGFPGRAAAGMRLLEAGDAGSYHSLRQAFILPQARLVEGRAAREAGVTAMTDTSDGLASDLRHICQQSGVGAQLSLAALPRHPQLASAAASRGWDIAELMLCGGEDYELLMTVPQALAAAAAARLAASAGVAVADIGAVTDAAMGITITAADGSVSELPERGFEHFRA